MKILHGIVSIDRLAGGTSEYIRLLLNELIKVEGLSIYLSTLISKSPYKLDNQIITTFNKPFILGYSISLQQYLKTLNVDLVHINALWSISIHQMCLWSRKNNLPYIISIHGMLEPWSLKQSSIKKKLAMLLYQHKDLLSAKCLHATALSEANVLRNLGYKNPIAIIPNGVDLLEYPLKNYDSSSSKRKILFLSRIHPKKGIEILIEAWEKLELKIKSDWIIEIAGNGEPEYISEIQKLIHKKGLNDVIEISGSKFGESKLQAYHGAELFVLPSYSENFGIVIAEALACGVPVITTKATPWSELLEFKCGDWIDIGVEPLIESLNVFLKKDKYELQKSGENGRALIKNKYSIHVIAKRFSELYNWLINNGEKPDFVI